MRRYAGLVAALAALLAAAGAGARPQDQSLTLPPAALGSNVAGQLASGWSLLAAGQPDEAKALADQLLTGDPRNAAVLALAIEAALATGGGDAGLDAYERWLGARAVEEAGALRRIARAFLLEWARQTTDPLVRVSALKALASEGTDEAARVLQAGSASGSLTDERALAEIGDDGAVDRVVDRMRTTSGSKVHDIDTLKRSRSPRAAPVLVDLLRDPLTENRASAADALGEIGGPEAIGGLRTALKDPHRAVRLAAAGSLYKLGDASGLDMLRELAASDQAAMRRSAAWLLASHPDDQWKRLVRGLAKNTDPAIRLDAAKLLAPHDPVFSRALFQSLVLGNHPVIRDEAAVALAESPVVELPALRQLLRQGSSRAKVHAAGKILALTR